LQHVRQRGVALLVVLWACTLLAVLLGGYVVLARTEGLQTRYQFAQTRAYYAAEAGFAQAIYALLDPQPQQRWIADGRLYTLRFDDAEVDVTVIDEGGKVDLNAALPEVLAGLFRAAGSRGDEARRLAAAVVAWRSPAPAGPDFAAMNGAKPRHAPFASLEELQQVPGMTFALYQRIAEDITLWSGRAMPDPASASALVLAAMPGMTPAQIAQIMQARLKANRASALAAATGVTHSIRAEATLAGGTRAVLRATVRLQGGRSGAQPYAVLHWQEGDGE
jgi:general secretion pathway protein K